MSSLDEILKAPVKTIVALAGIVLLPTSVVVYAYSVDVVNNRRDHSEYEKINASTAQIQAVNASQITANTININTLMAESKVNREQDKEQWDQLMDVLKTVIESR